MSINLRDVRPEAAGSKIMAVFIKTAICLEERMLSKHSPKYYVQAPQEIAEWRFIVWK